MKNKTKKRHSFIGNTIYMLKLLLKQDCSALPHCVLYDIGTVLMELNVVSFVTALTYCFENSKGIKAILLVTVIIAIIQMAVSFFNNREWNIICKKRTKNNREFDILLNEKLMDMDFELIEGPLGREKYQKAKNALKQHGVYCGI